MSWIWLIVALLLGALGGYILKDQLTDEFVSNVTMGKTKVRGRNNKQDIAQVTEVHMIKKSLKQKLKDRKASKKKE